MTIEKYLGVFVEGMIEMVIVVLVAVMVKGFTAVNLPGLNWEPLTTYVAIFCIVSLIINFVKGWIVPWSAIATIAGMVTMLVLSNGVFWSLAPEAVIEVIAYIIAAIVGLYLGVKFRGAGKNQEERYFLP